MEKTTRIVPVHNRASRPYFAKFIAHQGDWKLLPMHKILTDRMTPLAAVLVKLVILALVIHHAVRIAHIAGFDA
ncbi:hypothetical protein D3C81_1785270 [compost metagenome]